MKKIFFLVIALGGLFLVSVQAVRAESVSEETKATASVSKSVDVGNKICPVSGEAIDENTKATYEHEGKIYNFCCSACIPAFKNDPDKYIKNIEEQKQTVSDKKETHDMKTMESRESPDSTHSMH